MSIISEVILVGTSFLECLLVDFGAARAILKNSKNIKLVVKTSFVQFMKNFLTITAFFLWFSLLSQKAIAYDGKEFNHNLKNYNVKLQIFDDNQKIGEFFVAIVNDRKSRDYGLMNLEKLDNKRGMLFIFENSGIINMWMKNTLIALDMIFIDENNIIVNIAKDTKPLSLSIISSQKPIKKVLEINAGLSEKLGIKNGQKIIYENF